MGASQPTGQQGSGAHGVEGDGEADKFRIAPLERMLANDYATNIDVHLRLEDLAKKAAMKVQIYSRFSSDTSWHELGATKTNAENTLSPDFGKVLNIDFRVERARRLRFEVYRVRDVDAPEDLSLQKFIGVVECSIVDIILARSRGLNCGWLVRELQQPLPRHGGPPPGKLCIYGDEDINAKQVFGFTLAGAEIRSADFWKAKADPYCLVNRSVVHEARPEEGRHHDELECLPVYRSEVARRTGKPRWKRVELTASQLVGSLAANEKDIVIEVFDWFRVSQDKYVGESVFTLGDIAKAFRESRPLVRPICIRDGKRKLLEDQRRRVVASGGPSDSITEQAGGLGSRMNLSKKSKASARAMMSTKVSGTTANASMKSSLSQRSGKSNASGSERPYVFGRIVGNLILEDIGLMRAYTFLDYLRGGLELKLSIAIDLTRSNFGDDAATSKHQLDPQGGGTDSAYSTAIRAIGEVMRCYDDDDKYSVYGFGAKVPPSRTLCSDCFALSGDFWDPEVKGVDGIIRAYQRALHICDLHGPTHIHEVIKFAAACAKPYAEAKTPPVNGVDMKYFVFTILTDGEIHQEDRVYEELLKAMDLPIYFVIVGIGQADMTFLKGLPDELRRRKKEADLAELAELGESAAAMKEAKLAQEEAARKAAKRKSKKSRDEGPRPVVRPRSVVHFVAYDDFRDCPADLASATLRHLPTEVVSYYTGKNVAPRDLEKFEDDAGNPLPKTIPDKSKAEPGSKSSPSSRPSTKASIDSVDSAGSLVMQNSTASGVGGQKVSQRQRTLGSLPPFLKDEWDRVIKDTQGLGYAKPDILFALREGVPAASVEALVDCMVNGGFGKSPCYKDAALAAVPDPPTVSKIPGQTEGRMPAILASFLDSIPPDTDSKSTSGTKDRSSTLSRPSFSLAEGELAPSRRWSLPVSHGGTKEAGNSISGADGGSTRPSKGILKPRESSKEVERVSTTAHRRSIITTKESFVSEGSLRGAASVRFQEEDEEALDSSFLVRSAPVRRVSGGTGGGASSAQECGVCLGAAVATEFRPCGHRVACLSCAEKLRAVSVVCPLCQGVVQEVIALNA